MPPLLVEESIVEESTLTRSSDDDLSLRRSAILKRIAEANATSRKLLGGGGGGGRRTVQFNNTIEIKSTITRQDYSLQEIADCWYSEKDLKIIQESNKELLLLKSQNNRWSRTTFKLPIISSKNIDDDDDDIICLRGLEDKTTEGYEKIMSIRRDATLSVFCNSKQNNMSSNEIAIELAGITLNCRQVALERGLIDAEIAKYDDDYDLMTTTAGSNSNIILQHDNTTGSSWLSYVFCGV